MRAGGVNKKNVRQPSDYFDGTWAAGVEFCQDMFDRQAQPLTSISIGCLHMKDRRKHGQKRLGGPTLKLHAATHKLRDWPFTASAKNPVLAECPLFSKSEEIDRWHPR